MPRALLLPRGKTLHVEIQVFLFRLLWLYLFEDYNPLCLLWKRCSIIFVVLRSPIRLYSVVAVVVIFLDKFHHIYLV